MSESDLQRVSQRLVQIPIAAVLAGALIFLAFRYGPRPDARSEIQTTGAPLSSTVLPHFGAEFPGTLDPMDLALGSLGAERSVSAQGCDQSEPQVFFGKLETLYRNRGFVRIAQGTRAPPKPLSGISQRGMYWRGKVNGVQLFGWTDPSFKKNLRVPAGNINVTIGAFDTGCRTKWTTYRYTVSASRRGSRSTKAGGALGSGLGPIPQPTGSRLLFQLREPDGGEVNSYDSDRSVGELKEWYKQAMAPAWQFRETATETDGASARDSMYFTNSDLYCLIWLDQNAAKGGSTVMVVIGRAS